MKAVEITGVGQVIREMRNTAKEDRKAFGLGMDEVADLMRRRAIYYCPKDTRALARSHKVTTVKTRHDYVESELIAGGPEAPYAMWVHEDPIAYHKPPTCYKWLEKAEREIRPEVRKIIVAKLKEDKAKKAAKPADEV